MRRCINIVCTIEECMWLLDVEGSKICVVTSECRNIGEEHFYFNSTSDSRQISWNYTLLRNIFYLKSTHVKTLWCIIGRSSNKSNCPACTLAFVILVLDSKGRVKYLHAIKTKNTLISSNTFSSHPNCLNREQLKNSL